MIIEYLSQTIRDLQKSENNDNNDLRNESEDIY